jgi:hypothetical protein
LIPSGAVEAMLIIDHGKTNGCDPDTNFGQCPN